MLGLNTTISRTFAAAALAFGLTAGVPVAIAPTPAEARSAPDSFADLAERLSPAVVNVSTSQQVAGGNRFNFQFPQGSPFEELFKDFLERNRPGGENNDDKNGTEQRPRRRVTSLGSGFIIDPKGIIITNNHVIKDADEITVNLSDGRQLKAEVVGTDPETDLAVLKVEPEFDLPFVPWGDSSAARVGDWVVAIGNPFGLGGSVTAGIISARGRDINQGRYDDFIQTDASINRGNSGGPLFNMAGEVIGVNTAIFSPTGGSVGIGFSIPSVLAKNVTSQLQEFGRTRRGWLGVRIQTVTDEIAEGLGLESTDGALVAGVTPDGPAEKSGLKAGDIILEFNGERVATMRVLPRMVAETDIGREVPVRVWREGEMQTVQVQLGELKEDEVAALQSGDSAPQANEEVEALGMTLSTITPELSEKFQIEDGAEGVLVTDVGTDSPAAEKGIRPGDIIVEIANEPVASPADIGRRVADMKKNGRKIAVFRVKQKGVPRFVPLKLNEG